MSRSQDPHRAFFSHGNPFRMILPKGSRMSPRLQSLLNKFEETLSARLWKLNRKHKDDVLSFSSMKLAMQLLSETHQDFITELELPVYDWDDKWIDVYLDNTVKLLDICIALSSELSRLSQGKLLLQCALHNLDQSSSTSKFPKAKSSLDSWKQHVCAKNPRIENCLSIMEKLMEILELPKVKNSSEGKILMRAMYGVKVQTLFTCRLFISGFTSSDKNLIELQVSDTYLWAEAFNELQTFVNTEVKNRVSLLEQMDTSINEVYPMIPDSENPDVTEAFHNSVVNLGEKVDKFLSELDLLAKEVDAFFQIVLSGRDALLCNLSVSNSVFDPPKRYKVKGQLVK